MLDRIMKTASVHHPLSAVLGCFLSLYDNTMQLIGSQGSIQTDTPLGSFIPVLYEAIVLDTTSSVSHALVDIVQDVQEHKTKESLSNIDMKRDGICVVANGMSGVVLSDTIGIQTVADALTYIKKKHHMQGKVRVFSFTTQRIAIS